MDSVYVYISIWPLQQKIVLPFLVSRYLLSATLLSFNQLKMYFFISFEQTMYAFGCNTSVVLFLFERDLRGILRWLSKEHGCFLLHHLKTHRKNKTTKNYRHTQLSFSLHDRKCRIEPLFCEHR